MGGEPLQRWGLGGAAARGAKPGTPAVRPGENRGVRYGILGVTQAQDDQGTLIPIGGPRVRALLTALALRPDRTSAPQTLIDEVWSEEPPLDASAALQAFVGRLRRAIGRDAVVSEPGGYRLATARDSVDLFRFEDLVKRGRAALERGDAGAAARDLGEALALWHGPALADLPDRTAAARPRRSGWTRPARAWRRNSAWAAPRTPCRS